MLSALQLLFTEGVDVAPATSAQLAQVLGVTPIAIAVAGRTLRGTAQRPGLQARALRSFRSTTHPPRCFGVETRSSSPPPRAPPPPCLLQPACTWYCLCCWQVEQYAVAAAKAARRQERDALVSQLRSDAVDIGSRLGRGGGGGHSTRRGGGGGVRSARRSGGDFGGGGRSDLGSSLAGGSTSFVQPANLPSLLSVSGRRCKLCRVRASSCVPPAVAGLPHPSPTLPIHTEATLRMHLA
eukprot:364229-Chlamydomonas_euryale.AAC.1